MKGGINSFGDTDTIGMFLNNGLRNQSIQIENFGQIANSSFILKLSWSILDNNFLNIYPGTDFIVSNTTQLLVKLVQINDNDQSIKNGKEVVTSEIFYKEVEMQTNIYNSSLDCWFEPICPSIIKSGIVSYNSRQPTDLDEYNDVIEQLLRFMGFSSSDYKVGYIFMELIESAKMVSTLFPDYSEQNPVIPNGNFSDLQACMINNYVYQLYRLYSIGYIHGDVHLGNALYMENYDYIQNHRVYLIDFGKTEPISLSNNYLYTYTPHDFWSYRQMKSVLENVSLEQLTEMCNLYESTDINDARHRFIEKLYNDQILLRLNPVLITHPDLRLLNIDLIFKVYNIPLRNYQIEETLNVNTTFNNSCKYDIKSNGITKKYYINILKENYDQEIVTMVKNANLIKSFCDSEFNSCILIDALFLWIIGVDVELKPKIFFILVESCFEFATKHSTLMQLYGITNLYCAGEMIKKGSSLTFNLLSGSYTILPFLNGTITDTMISSLNNIVVSFAKYKLNRDGYDYQIQMTSECLNNTLITDQPSLIIKENCCNIDVSYFNSINEVFIHNGRDTIFGAYEITNGGESKSSLVQRKGIPQNASSSKNYIENGKTVNYDKQNINPNIQNDIKIGEKLHYTINKLFMNETNIKFAKIISSETNINFINNIQILIEYAKICSMNLYNNCINTTQLSNSTIKENIIFINPISGKIENTKLTSNPISGTIKDTKLTSNPIKDTKLTSNPISKFPFKNIYKDNGIFNFPLKTKQNVNGGKTRKNRKIRKNRKTGKNRKIKQK